jgi:hypothetical protein
MLSVTQQTEAFEDNKSVARGGGTECLCRPVPSGSADSSSLVSSMRRIGDLPLRPRRLAVGRVSWVEEGNVPSASASVTSLVTPRVCGRWCDIRFPPAFIRTFCHFS